MRQETLFIIHVQAQCCDLFIFSLKKRVDVFDKWLSVFLPRGWGHTYLQLQKLSTNGKVKTKNGYVQLEK